MIDCYVAKNFVKGAYAQKEAIMAGIKRIASQNIWQDGVILTSGKKLTAKELREIDDIIKIKAGRDIYKFYQEDLEDATLADLGDNTEGADLIALPEELPDFAYKQILEGYQDICGDNDNLTKGSDAEQDAIVSTIRENSLGEEAIA
jgi:hypothetical protein